MFVAVMYASTVLVQSCNTPVIQSRDVICKCIEMGNCRSRDKTKMSYRGSIDPESTTFLVRFFTKNKAISKSAMAHSHSHDGVHSHSHDHASTAAAEHGHTHEILDGPGSYMGREMPIIEGRNWSERAFTVGIGG